MKSEQFLAIGLTGGIASGKTLASQHLSRKYPVHDADLLVHELYKSDQQLIGQIADLFGSDVVENGVVRRDRLRKLVFNDADMLRALNKMVHPAVTNLLRQLIRQSKENHERSIFVIPLLCENGWNRELDGTLLVACNPEIQIERVIRRDQCCISEAENVISSQMSVEEKIKYCDWMIENNGSREDFLQSLDHWEGQL